MLGQDLARPDADHRRFRVVAGVAEAFGRDRRHMHGLARDRFDHLAPRKGRIVGQHAAAQDHAGAAIRRIVQHHDVGALAGGDLAAILQAKGLGRRQRRGAIDRQRIAALFDEAPDHVVQMPVFGDVQRVPVIRAQAHIGRGHGRQHLGQRLEILADRPFTDQHPHPLLQLFHRLGGRGRLVFRADAGADIGVQILSAQQRRVPVDMPPFEGLQLGHRARIAKDHAGIVHELGQSDHAGMVGQGGQIIRRQFGPRRFHMCRGHAGGQVHADIHHRARRGVQEIADPRQAADIGDFMRVADRGGDAPGQHAAVEFIRRDAGRFDMQMRVDEAGHQELAGHVDDPLALVTGADAHDPVAANGHVARNPCACHHVPDGAARQHQIGGFVAAPLRDTGFQRHDDSLRRRSIRLEVSQRPPPICWMSL